VSPPIVIRPEAEADALAAREWYDERQDGLGQRFGQAVVDLLERIAVNPLVYPRVHRDTRRAVLSGFPCAIYFRVHEETLVVIAVHGRQHPRHWQGCT